VPARRYGRRRIPRAQNTLAAHGTSPRRAVVVNSARHGSFAARETKDRWPTRRHTSFAARVVPAAASRRRRRSIDPTITARNVARRAMDAEMTIVPQSDTEFDRSRLPALEPSTRNGALVSSRVDHARRARSSDAACYGDAARGSTRRELDNANGVMAGERSLTLHRLQPHSPDAQVIELAVGVRRP